MGGAISQQGAKGTGWETPPRLGTPGRQPGRIIHRHKHCAATDLEASTAYGARDITPIPAAPL